MTELPEQFQQLQKFANIWALPTELQRSEQRWIANEAQYQDFYDAMLPILDDVLAYLDQYQIGAIPENVLPLYHLALAFAESAPHTELYANQSQVPNSFEASRFQAAHGNEIDA